MDNSSSLSLSHAHDRSALNLENGADRKCVPPNWHDPNDHRCRTGAKHLLPSLILSPNFNYEGQSTRKVTLEAIETVTVAAGSFGSCLKFHKQALDSSDPTPEWNEWVKPGLGMVKWIDYWGVESGPIVYELQSWSPADP